ncbi:hypothetical protein Tco_0310104 [Tanacetum coccineum]
MPRRGRRNSNRSLGKALVRMSANAVLLRSSRNRLLMKYANTFIVFRHNLVDEFRSVICADESDCFVEANLYLLKKVGDKLWSFIL